MPLAQGEGIIGSAKLIQHGKIDQADGHGPGLHIGIVVVHIAGAQVEDGIAPRVQRARPFKGHVEIQRIAGGAAVRKVQEIHAAAGRGIDDLHKLRIVLGGLVHVHDALGALRPLYDQRLADPEAARPGAAVIAAGSAHDLAGIDAPRNAEGFVADAGRAVGRALAIVVTAEGNNALHSGVLLADAKGHRRFPRIAFHLGSVDLKRSGIAPVAGLCAVHGVGRIKLWRRRRLRRGLRCGRKRRRGKEADATAALSPVFAAARSQDEIDADTDHRHKQHEQYGKAGLEAPALFPPSAVRTGGAAGRLAAVSSAAASRIGPAGALRAGLSALAAIGHSLSAPLPGLGFALGAARLPLPGRLTPAL